MANEFNTPEAPPGPIFFNKKERDFTKQINDEIIENIISQTIAYYPLSLEHTRYHPLYGEAIKKSFLPPVIIKVLVEFGNIQTIDEGSGPDKDQEINVFFQKRRLTDDKDLYIREGDYIQYGETYYEIVSLEEGNPLYGNVQHLFEIKAICKRSRKGKFNHLVAE